MAKTKSELIDEAEARGIDLEGNETVEDLKTLLADADADGDDAPVDPPVADAAPELVLDPEVHYFLEGDAVPRTYKDKSEIRLYRLAIDGRNFEHCANHESGCWIYRNQP